MVRFALPTDAAGLAELRWLSREPEAQGAEPLGRFSSRFSAWLTEALASGSWCAAVAPSGTQLLGCMYLQRVATVPVPGIASRHWGYITHAFVLPPHRGRGLGTRMLELLVDKARELQLHELHVWPSVAAVSLYARAGFLSPEQQRAAVQPDEPSHVLSLVQTVRGEVHRGGQVIEVILKRFDRPDEVTRFTNGIFETVTLGGMTIGRATYQPGWKWSKDVGPGVGQAYCDVEHVGLVLSGCATATFADGRITEMNPGDIFYVPPEPHDSWVVGDEPYVSLHFLGAGKYAK